MSLLNEDLMKTNLDIPEGEIKIDGAVNPVYADAINVHNKKKKEIEKTLKDKKPELKKPFLGTKGNTTIIPKTKDMKKLKLAEDMFRPVREAMVDAPEAYEGIFRVIDNMEHIINYISELSDEELCYEDMQQSYNVLDEAMVEFSGYLEELKGAERAKDESLEEATAVIERPIANVHTHKGSLSSIIEAHLSEINAMINGYVPKEKFLSKLKSWIEEAELTGRNAEYADNVMRSLSTAKDTASIGKTLWDIRLAGENRSLKVLGLGRRKWESLEEATAVMDRKSTKPIKDIWDDIYAELVGVKSIEASRRRLDRTPSQRYPADYRNEGPRVGMSRYEDALVVKADELSQLDFGKEVAETYGVEWRVKEHTSMYADSKYELLIYPFKPVISESLVESVDNEVYSAVAKYYDYGAPSNFIEVIADLVDRALLNKKEGYDVDEAVMDAIDSGLIYHKDIWTIKSGYEDSILSDDAYEQLRNDLYSIVDSFEDEEIEEGLTSTQRYNKKMDKIFDDKKNRDADMVAFIKANSDISDEEIKKLKDDVIEFYTWYDKEGNVIHEPSDDNLDEAVCNYIENYDGFMIYECDGKYSADVHGKSVSGKSIEEIKSNIDKADKEYRDYFNHLDN